jgi:hypothetical protein
MTMLCHQRLLGGEDVVCRPDKASGLRLTARKNRLRCGSVAPWHILSKALGELNQSHFLSFNAAPSNVVTIACIRPSLVM